ncbi:hypothetical protein [Paramicrobacterium agarici]|uniref:SnoaL-like protein n=1 Tax=Paramicrobacterium agarici TaxID=630514 RepID=A0A2A9DU20_9MICO|nr:hypothetical protein [Microbacterium agarici]PFG30084.1 hypothetical protein ATJ78_1005 [Microbacterium agarici]
MEINLPSDCGNAPRTIIVGEFVAKWAQGESDAVAEWLADEARWSIVGEGTHLGPRGSREAIPRITAERLDVLSIVAHGRFASCDGYLEAGTTRIAFSHVFRFAGASKSAKVAELRTYLVQTS